MSYKGTASNFTVRLGIVTCKNMSVTYLLGRRAAWMDTIALMISLHMA